MRWGSGTTCRLLGRQFLVEDYAAVIGGGPSTFLTAFPPLAFAWYNARSAATKISSLDGERGLNPASPIDTLTMPAGYPSAGPSASTVDRINSATRSAPGNAVRTSSTTNSS